MDNAELKLRSPYRRGADNGLVIGIYLTALFFSTMYAVNLPVLSLVSLCLMAAIPFVVYAMLRRSYVSDSGTTPFSSLWMQGITAFLCGAMISGVVAVIFMRFIRPGFFDDWIDSMISFYSATDWDRGKELAEILTAARDQHLFPRVIEITIDMMWLMAFSGSMLSMLMALLVQARSVKGSSKGGLH